MKLNVKSFGGEPKCEYSVQFECYSTFLAYFEGEAGLSEKQIIERALRIAEGTFGRGGSLTVERSSKSGSYAFQGLGVDRRTARILGRSSDNEERPNLRLVK